MVLLGLKQVYHMQVRMIPGIGFNIQVQILCELVFCHIPSFLKPALLLC
jgi:hypothetical protein